MALFNLTSQNPVKTFNSSVFREKKYIFEISTIQQTINLKPEELSETVDHIFAENGKEGLDSFTQEDLQKSLWMTDFHQKLSLYFGS